MVEGARDRLKYIAHISGNAARFSGFIAHTAGQIVFQKVFSDWYLGSVLRRFDMKKVAETIASKVNLSGIHMGIIADCFSSLRGEGLSIRERKVETLIGAICEVYDSLFDDLGVDPEKINGLVYHTQKPSNPNEGLLERLTGKLHSLMSESDNPQFYKAVDMLHQAQVASLRQKEASTPLSDILDISKTKGGLAAIVIRQGLGHPLVHGEYDALYSLGGYLQLCDDLWDIPLDRMSGIRTIGTEAAEHAAPIIQKAKSDAARQILQMDYPQGNKKYFLFLVHMVEPLMQLRYLDLERDGLTGTRQMVAAILNSGAYALQFGASKL